MKNDINSKYSAFKFQRLIGNPFEKNHNQILSPKNVVKIFKILLENMSENYNIKRLVLTAPAIHIKVIENG